MIYAFLTAILFIAVILGGGAMFAFNYFKNKRRGGGSKVVSAVAVGMIAVGLLLVILIPGSFHTVDAGTVAVVRQMGVIADVEGPALISTFISCAGTKSTTQRYSRLK